MSGLIGSCQKKTLTGYEQLLFFSPIRTGKQEVGLKTNAVTQLSLTPQR